MGLNADPNNPSHIRLHQLSEDDGENTLRFAVGWADGTAAPTAVAAGSLALITVTNAGSGYTSAPTVNITGGGGTGATATAVVDAGEVVGINITNPGSGYTSAPNIAFTGGAGTGAAGAAEVSQESDFVLPPSRTWFTFSGYVADFPFNFALNAVVASTVAIQRSGGSAWIRKVA
ncbi:phage tail tube protein [Pseudomonas putida]|uniref:phage tail tube protein n=2 Tax=Pseudomonas TaxID=286 RepID=UPI003F963412